MYRYSYCNGIVESSYNSPLKNMGKINSNFSVKPSNVPNTPVRPRPQAPAGVNVIQPNSQPQNPQQRPMNGIKPPADLRSNVKEQTLNIPNFLKR